MEEPGIVLNKEQKQRRRGRSIAIGLALGGLVVLLYLITIVKMGPDIIERPM